MRVGRCSGFPPTSGILGDMRLAIEMGIGALVALGINLVVGALGREQLLLRLFDRSSARGERRLLRALGRDPFLGRDYARPRR